MMFRVVPTGLLWALLAAGYHIVPEYVVNFMVDNCVGWPFCLNLQHLCWTMANQEQCNYNLSLADHSQS